MGMRRNIREDSIWEAVGVLKLRVMPAKKMIGVQTSGNTKKFKITSQNLQKSLNEVFTLL